MDKAIHRMCRFGKVCCHIDTVISAACLRIQSFFITFQPLQKASKTIFHNIIYSISLPNTIKSVKGKPKCLHLDQLSYMI